MDVRAQLTVKNKQTGERRVYRLDQDRASVGRDQSNYVVLDGRAISRRHAEIIHEPENRQFFLRDLKSNNGTALNEKPLAPQEKVLLRSGDLIQVEGYDLLFHVPSGKEAEDIFEVTDTDLLEVKMVKKLIKAMDKDNSPSLEVLEGVQSGLRFVLEEKNQDIAIGRAPSCEFVIDSDVISRKHARIEKKFDTVIIHDLDSKNGTFVNRGRLERNGEKRIHDGDIIHLGTLALSFRNPQELSFDFEPPKIQKPPEESSAPKPELIKGEENSALPMREAGVRGAQEAPPNPNAARGSRRREGAQPSQPAQEPQEYLDEQVPETVPVPTDIPQEPPSQAQPEAAGAGGFRLSFMEIVAIAIGLLVLVGSVWGIIKLLK